MGPAGTLLCPGVNTPLCRCYLISSVGSTNGIHLGHLSSPRLDLWPGFVASILQYEDNVMLCADVSHKIMRADTVYDYLDELFQQHSDDARFHNTAMKNLVGEIVLTRSGYSYGINCGRRQSLVNGYLEV